jgi:hypothetical protein
MNTLETISRNIRVKQAISTANFEVEYKYEHEEGIVPEMITAKAIAKTVDEEDPKPLIIDLAFYTNTSNLQVTCHNKPAVFDSAVINEVTGPIADIIAGIEAA